MVDDPRDPRNRAAKISERYNQAQQGREQRKEAAPRRESDMVRQDQPRLQPTPNGPMRGIADRQSYDQRLEAERKSRAEELKKSIQQNRGHDQGRDAERERDRSR